MALVLSLLSASGAAAATLTVTSTEDSIDGSCMVSRCSLRDAIEAANAASGPTTIALPAGAYQLQHGELLITSPNLVTVRGAGPAASTILGEYGSRVLRVAGKANVAGVTLTAGAPIEQRPGEEEWGLGGGIYNEGTLTLEETVVSHNMAESGGGIISFGPLDVIRSLLADNRASYQGAGAELDGPTSFSDSTIAGNEGDSQLPLDPAFRGGGENGGGVTNYGALALSGTTIAGNGLAPASGREGAGIDLAEGSVTASDSIIAGNTGASQCVLRTAISAAPNLDSDASCFAAAGDLHADPLLEGLAENGGPTETMALGPLSPAVSAGKSCDALDQRGEPRPAEGCSLGAFQYVSPAPPSEPPPTRPVGASTGTTSPPAAAAVTAPAPAGHISVQLAPQAGGDIGLLVITPGAGQLEATATEQNPGATASSLTAGRGRFAYAASAASARGGGTMRLTLRPSAAGRSIIRRHHRYGWPLNVRVTVLFLSKGGSAERVTRYLRILAGSRQHH